MSVSIEAALVAREAERRAALVNDDMAALADLMCDDLVHVHATGAVHGKQDLLKHAGGTLKFIDVERGPLHIRQLGPDAAVMTGSMVNTIRRRDHDERIRVSAYVTQVWVRVDECWKVTSFHAVRMPDEQA